MNNKLLSKMIMAIFNDNDYEFYIGINEQTNKIEDIGKYSFPLNNVEKYTISGTGSNKSIVFNDNPNYGMSISLTGNNSFNLNVPNWELQFQLKYNKLDQSQDIIQNGAKSSSVHNYRLITIPSSSGTIKFDFSSRNDYQQNIILAGTYNQEQYSYNYTEFPFNPYDFNKFKLTKKCNLYQLIINNTSTYLLSSNLIIPKNNNYDTCYFGIQDTEGINKLNANVKYIKFKYLNQVKLINTYYKQFQFDCINEYIQAGSQYADLTLSYSQVSLTQHLTDICNKIHKQDYKIILNSNLIYGEQYDAFIFKGTDPANPSEIYFENNTGTPSSKGTEYCTITSGMDFNIYVKFFNTLTEYSTAWINFIITPSAQLSELNNTVLSSEIDTYKQAYKIIKIYKSNQFIDYDRFDEPLITNDLIFSGYISSVFPALTSTIPMEQFSIPLENNYTYNIYVEK